MMVLRCEEYPLRSSHMHGIRSDRESNEEDLNVPPSSSHSRCCVTGHQMAVARVTAAKLPSPPKNPVTLQCLPSRRQNIYLGSGSSEGIQTRCAAGLDVLAASLLSRSFPRTESGLDIRNANEGSITQQDRTPDVQLSDGFSHPTQLVSRTTRCNHSHLALRGATTRNE